MTKYKSENYNKTKKGKIMINKQELHDIFLKLRAGDTSQFELLYIFAIICAKYQQNRKNATSK